MLKRIIKFFRNCAIFAIALSISFSNVAFYSLTKIIDSHIAYKNIVDKSWHLSQDDNVVDKFTSYRHLAEKVKIHKAYAAALEYVGGAEASGNNAAYNVALTSLVGGTGGAVQTGDLVIVSTGFVQTSNLNPGVSTAGYTEVADLYQNDTRDANLSVNWKYMSGAPDTAVNCLGSGSATNGAVCVVHVWRNADPANPLDVVSTTAQSNNSSIPNSPAITPITAGSVVISTGLGTGAAADTSVTAPTGYGNKVDISVDPGNASTVGIASKAWSGSGAEDPAAWTTWTTTTSDSWAAVTLAIRPEPPPDTTPPTPSPMTFLTPPANDSTTQISMTADTATDADTPPVEYFFTLDNTNCAANAGTGGTSSAWQAGTSYSDSGLTANKCYGYTVKARDSAGTPNETTASGISSAYTSANTPGTPALGSPTASTLNLTNAENSNPTANPTTNYAVWVVTTSDGTWFEKWIDASGNPSATAVWLTDAQLDTLVLQGLQSSTLYGVKVKARNQDNDETPLSAEGQGTTSAPATTLTISQTAGSKVATKNSGDVNQYAHDTACTGAGTCSAFTLASAGGTTNVTSIKITESGTVTANTELSDLNLYYDYDGNWADAGAETLFGTVANFAGDQTATVSGTLAITDGATAYIYARYDLANGAVYPVGGATVNFQIAASTDVVSDATESGTGALVGTQTVKPQITGYTNSTEPALDYAGACTGCGVRIGGGSGFRHTVVISGYGFGADPGLGSRDTASNKVEIAGTATTLLADDGSANTNVSAWSNTSITIRTDTNITGNSDTDFGTNFGGATALKVTAGGQAVPTNLNFYIFPQITSLTQPGGFPADSAREYDAGDTDGIITLNGTRFGSSLGSGAVTILGSSATTNSWSNTAIEARVPIAISDSVYTGAVAMTQGTGGNSKTHSYSTLRILPRITSLVPSNGIIGASVTVNGDHLCQAGAASCPVAFGANDNVTFTSAVDATVFTSWSNIAIVTAVPTGAVTGNVVVTSNAPPAYTSNALTFTVNANTTTLATGSDPAVNTIAPGASATDVDLFTLQTNGGTESVTSVTVNLSTHLGIGLLAITDNANTVLGSTASPVTGSNVISVAGMSAGTGVTTFKVRATPLSHASMSAPAGASYAVTAPVTAWAGANTHAGSDTNTNALTIDNTSPAGTTGATPTAGDTQVQVSWSNPGDSDFQKVIIYCKTSSITETPTEGSDPSVDATTCDATARVKYNGSVSPQTITGLSNGTLYYFRIYARDTNGNFTAIASTQQVSATPTLTQTLTVGTVGTQAVNLNSGSTAQHIGGAGTAAFTLQINTGSSNATSVKVSETGTVAMANLANPKLYYENAANPASCAYGGAESFVSGAAPVGETVTFTLPSVAVGLTANVTCLYFVSDVTSSAVGGQTIELQITNPSTDVAVSSGVNDDTVAKAITGTTTVKPQITGYTNSTEPALDYAGACTGCGARIGSGSGFRHTVVISGYGFGADPGLGSRDTATNKVEIAGTATTVLADDGSANTNVSAWSNTSITIRTDSNIATNTDTDFGTNFGGATALKVTAGGQAVPTNLNFYIFPQITSITQPGGFPADSAREYDAGDTDGVITLNGTRFGSSLGSGAVTILGSSATTNSWSNTAIEARVPTAISDSVYTGAVAMTQGTGSNSKTDSYSTLRILPRITSLDPTSASVGDPITVNGNHLCQAGAASCPVAFGANDKVTFTSAVDATVFTSWSNTAIVTAVPTGAVTGNVVVTSNAPTYISNGSSFTLASATPDEPTDLGQFKDAGFAQAIAIEGTASSTPIYLKMTMSAVLSGGTLYPQFEYKPIGTAFTCGAGACGAVSEGASSAGPGPATGSVSVSPTDEVYHWQARIRHNRNSVDYYSAWVPFGGNGENETDFKIDTTAPVITSTSSGSPGTNGATITWSTSGEISTSRVEYDTAGTFTGGYDCAGTSECTTLADTSPMVNSHSVTLSNLNSGATYHYRVRSKDAAGNEKIDPTSGDYTFVTQTENHPAKTTETFIDGATGSISSATTYHFKVDAPEVSPSVKSAYVEVVGVVSGGTGTVTVAVNGSSRAYDVSATNPTLYRFMYPIASPNTETNLNLNDVAPCSNADIPGTPPQCNKVVLTPATVIVNVLSAKIITTYSYTP